MISLYITLSATVAFDLGYMVEEFCALQTISSAILRVGPGTRECVSPLLSRGRVKICPW